MSKPKENSEQYNVERTELISRYLNKEMTESEEQKFMLLLESDPTLKSEMELQENIIWELRASAIREHLKKVRGKSVKSIVMWTLTVAATVLIACVCTYRHYANVGIEISTPVLSNLVMPTLRGAAAQEQKIDTAYIHIKEGNLSLAQEELKSAILYLEDIIDHPDAEITDPDERLYEKTLSTSLLHRARYLQALCNMQQGNVITAHRQLNNIADSDSPYKSEARKLLEMW
ncbi:MAG: hypothetical protein IJP50_02920 [Paludibacteraceae bacterium]|nr:hypothetical protein [Paludibacteraceae bacterium]